MINIDRSIFLSMRKAVQFTDKFLLFVLVVYCQLELFPCFRAVFVCGSYYFVNSLVDLLLVIGAYLDSSLL